MKSQSQRKLNDIHYLNKYNKNLNSEDSEEDNWINSNLKRNKNIEASQTPSCSIKIPSSTSNHTTPNAQCRPECEKSKDKQYLSKQDFKSFINQAKRVASNSRSQSNFGRSSSISPFRIVNKLLDDATKRQESKVKTKEESAFALTFSVWNKTLRSKSNQQKSKQEADENQCLQNNEIQDSNQSQIKRKRCMSAQRFNEMISRFKFQEKSKQEILERERQLKIMKSNEGEEEIKNNVHKKYLQTKFKQAHGNSRWTRTNSQEVIDRMYNRVFDKQQKNKEKCRRKC